ncbi:MAG TPA: hypothetical protein VEU30_14200 [Thermoanaerobaculia bacterium]|nr:hypothetical protein [Thermoanaerobaculia bacterium]
MTTHSTETVRASLVPAEAGSSDVLPSGYNADLAYSMAVFSSATYNLYQQSALQIPTGWTLNSQFYYTDVFGNSVTIGAVFESSTAVTLAFRGTQTWQELVITDCDLLPATPGWIGYWIVHLGFNNMYSPIRQSVMNILNEIVFGTRAFYITGHSLGGALATLAAADYTANNAGYPVTAVYTFGSPRVVSYLTFAQYYNGASGISNYTYRVARPADVVTQVPTPPLYYHVSQLVSLAGTTNQDGLTSHPIDAYIDLLDPV